MLPRRPGFYLFPYTTLFRSGREFVDVAVAAQDLDRVERHLGRRFGGVEDRAGGVLPGCLSAVTGTRDGVDIGAAGDRKSTRLNSSHLGISYAVFCLKNKKQR